ncbi:MAG: ribbon-helix-helix protein, CopG family [Betaproteobacteria bacterium]|nr:ribbon-helix-helix protein, CopG family [Betaproteobacteria bacterium]
MSRILVDLPEAQLEELALLVEEEQRPRAAVIREAIGEYLVHHRQGQVKGVFGLWKNRQVDGLEYQRELRSEW